LPNQAKQTDHVIWRMAQRHFSMHEIEYVMQYGVKYRRAGVLHCYLRRKDIPPCDRRHSRYSRLEGLTVLLDSQSGEKLITAYRNRGKNALKAIRCKAKFNKKR
jgi:hypothetical protein